LIHLLTPTLTQPFTSLSPPSPLPPTNRRQRLLPERQCLPVWAAKEQLVREVASHPTLIVVGETGSGKTTQV